MYAFMPAQPSGKGLPWIEDLILVVLSPIVGFALTAWRLAPPSRQWAKPNFRRSGVWLCQAASGKE
jgi:hypothetical protein